MFKKPKPTISVKEARKLLGKKSRGLTDQEVESLIFDLTEVARRHLLYNGSKKA